MKDVQNFAQNQLLYPKSASPRGGGGKVDWVKQTRGTVHYALLGGWGKVDWVKWTMGKVHYALP